MPVAVSSVDIMPTILARVNPAWYFLNKNKFDGKDLNRIAQGKDIKRRYIYSYVPWLFSVRDTERNIKYYLSKKGTEKLFFLPDEYNNRINDNSQEASLIKEKLRLNLKNWLRHYPVRADLNAHKKPLDEKAKNLLKSLGYLN